MESSKGTLRQTSIGTWRGIWHITMTCYGETGILCTYAQAVGSNVACRPVNAERASSYRYVLHAGKVNVLVEGGGAEIVAVYLEIAVSYC